MTITVTVELYTGFSKERTEVEVTKEDIQKLAEQKAADIYQCNSCQAIDMKLIL